MAASFASSMIKWTAEKLSSLLPKSDGTHGEGGLKDLQDLHTTMQRIHALVKDGDELHTIPDHSERLRLKELKDVAYEAEDVIDEYGYEVLRSQIEGPISTARNSSSCKKRKVEEEAGEMSNEFNKHPRNPVPLPVPDELARRTREIRNKFEEIISDWEKLRWREGDGYRLVDLHSGIRLPSTSLVYKPDIHGRDKDKENVINMLLSENRQRPSSVSVLPLTGMAGVGKTTLARLVYNDLKINGFFSLKGWVCVGGEVDVRVLTKNILMSFTEQNCDLTELQNLQRRLLEEVRGKRFFLVLDDVWNHDANIWDSLKAPFVSAQSGAIIITTYNMKVARVMETMHPYPVKPLSFNDSWSLFKQTAFQYEGSYALEELLEIGKNIVRKCEGLPLAVKTIGAALRLENDEDKWNDVLKSDLWESDSMKGTILPALKLSYDRMPNHLKQCFLFFSLFPNEFVLLKDKIIRLWMSLGLLCPERRKSIEEIGCDTFDGILRWSMIQQTHYEGVDAFVLHNVFHNLFKGLVLEEFSIVRGENHRTLNGTFQNIRYLSVVNDYQNSIVLGPNQSSTALRLLQILDPKNKWNNYHIDIKFHCDLFENLRHVRFLDFTDCLMEELPDSIGNLKQLRYLCLTNTGIDHLPESTSNLYNLQTIELIKCPIKRLPGGIKNLINMRHLSFQQWFPICMPSGIGRLVNLNTLPRFHTGKDDWHCNIAELNGLVNLREELHISGLMNVSSAESARKANLHNKQYLKILRLDWSNETSQMCCDHSSSLLRGNHEFDVDQTMVLESLKPHPNLKELEISGFPGNRYPNWLVSGYFIKLVKISLNGCGHDECLFLPALGQLPSLKTLSIKGMQSVRRVGHEFCSPNESTKGFPSLETLVFDDMPNWIEWIGDESGEFSSLCELKIVDCPKLRNFPKFSSASLKTLEITDCSSVELPDSPSIRSLTLKGKIGEAVFSSIRMPLLRCLKVCHSRDIRSIRLNKQSIPSLEVLVIHDCRNLATIVGFSDLKSLRLLKLSACRNINFSLDESIPWMLRRLCISRCPNLHAWEQIQKNKYKNQLTRKLDAYCDEDLEALAKLSDDEEETFQRLSKMALQ